jgi:hypothetical protein
MFLGAELIFVSQTHMLFWKNKPNLRKEDESKVAPLTKSL